MKTLLPLSLALVLSIAPLAHAADTDTDDNNWVVRFGAHVVAPKDDNGRLAGMKTTISNNVRPTASIEYMLTPALGIDALAAIPFRHDIRLDGQRAATTKQLPPTFGLNYHFLAGQTISPFVGAGFNYTRFFSTKGEGILQGAQVHIDNSWGAAAHAGIDFNLSPQWMITADVRWIEIRGDVHVNGANVGKAEIDPWVYGVSAGYRF
ncbi:MAG TPA: OmpW family outer membrane protein [Dyella sp.]|uniref:OmpW/AlkL family protein n=1 Tax=Dyella sp. TaxID=1869338 RepID=UPI002BCBA7AD|nr:OmpW family outer membrane protein [Dyella sp.]HUB91862.1 OmpW family outer membrane protein [Dyella sp.]